MNTFEILLLEQLLTKKYINLNQIKRDVGRSLSTISEALKSLKTYGFEFEDKGYILKSNKLLLDINSLRDKYSLQILAHNKESVLFAVLFFQTCKDISDFVKLSESQVLRNMNFLLEKGIVRFKENKYFIDEAIKPIVENIYVHKVSKNIEPYSELIIKKGVIFKVVPYGSVAEGMKTAYSCFEKYGIIYNIIYDYYVITQNKMTIEDVLIHSFLLAKNKKDYAMAMCFYIKNKDAFDFIKLRKGLVYFEIYDLFEKMIEYLREDARFDLFLPKKEFIRILNEYDLILDRLNNYNNVISFFNQLGTHFSSEFNIYLIGGCNLVLRNLKGVTKDIDVIVKSETDYLALETVLLSDNFVKDFKLSNQYEQLKIRMVFRKDNNQIDVFVKKVLNQIELNSQMIEKANKKEYAKLNVWLLSLEDIILFKSIAGREADVEDLFRILAKENINWDYFYDQFLLQFDKSSDLLFLSILETLELLSEKHKISIIPKIERFVLEKAILFVCKTPKSILNIRKVLDFPEYTIRNVINKQVKEKQLKSISGKPILFQTING